MSLFLLSMKRQAGCLCWVPCWALGGVGKLPLLEVGRRAGGPLGRGAERALGGGGRERDQTHVT